MERYSVDVFREIQQPSTKPASRFSAYWKASGPGLGSWLPFVIFYTVLANIPFWAASPWLGISLNGWFCLDYIAVGLVALFVPGILSGGLLFLVIAIDLVGGVSETYFLPVSQFFTNVGAVRQFSASRVVALSGVVLLSLLAAATAWALPVATIQRKYRARTAACLIVFAVVSLTVDCAIVFQRTGDIPGLPENNRSLANAIPAGYMPQLRVSRIPSIRLLHKRFFPAPNGLPVGGATALALGFAKQDAAKNGRQMPNFVVVLVESWGLDTESSVNGALVQPYAQTALLARYKVIQGTVPFYGPTLSGEARELCGSTMGFHLMDASKQELRGCLPDRLDAMGYHSLALHGMVGQMFDRLSWYKNIGFQETWFFFQFLHQGLPVCPGPFPGICDADIASWMGRRLEKDQASPDFLYWVTLNSHLPVPVPSPLKAGASCSFATSLSHQPALCSWYQLIANVHHSVADLAMGNLGRPTVFVIVGDHAPPFSDSTVRHQFSATFVPYVILVPRRDSSHSFASPARK